MCFYRKTNYSFDCAEDFLYVCERVRWCGKIERSRFEYVSLFFPHPCNFSSRIKNSYDRASSEHTSFVCFTLVVFGALLVKKSWNIRDSVSLANCEIIGRYFFVFVFVCSEGFCASIKHQRQRNVKNFGLRVSLTIPTRAVAAGFGGKKSIFLWRVYFFLYSWAFVEFNSIFLLFLSRFGLI